MPLPVNSSWEPPKDDFHVGSRMPNSTERRVFWPAYSSCYSSNSESSTDTPSSSSICSSASGGGGAVLTGLGGGAGTLGLNDGGGGRGRPPWVPRVGGTGRGGLALERAGGGGGGRRAGC
jgi:hypothetical protein